MQPFNSAISMLHFLSTMKKSASRVRHRKVSPMLTVLQPDSPQQFHGCLGATLDPKHCGCCHGNGTSTQFTRRWLELLSWILPGAVLALLPKCPACFAAYLFLAAGIGVSLSTATYLRYSLILFSIVSLSYVAVKWLVRGHRRLIAPHSSLR